MGEASDYSYSLLGLGDVAVPGLLACLALRCGRDPSFPLQHPHPHPPPPLPEAAPAGLPGAQVRPLKVGEGEGDPSLELR